MSSKVRVSFKGVQSSRLDRGDAHPMHTIAHYSIGFGRVGKGFNTRSTKPPQFRTFIRIRTEAGVCWYLYRTHPEKHKIVQTCRYYEVVKEISRDEVIRLITKQKLELIERP